MKKFVITAESDLVEVETRTNDIEVALDLFEGLSKDTDYFSIDLTDGETGEVYAYQRIVRDPCGVTVMRWVVN